MINHKIWLTLLLCLLLCACLLPAAYADGLNDLQSAVNGHAAEFTLTENTAIPANTTIDASGTKIIVPLGKTLTVAGKLIVDDFSIEQNPQLNQRGVLSIPEGGELHVKGWHNLSNNIWTNWRRTGETGRISFADGAGFYLMRGGITDADGIGYAIRDASDTQYNDIAENDHLRLYAIASGFNWVLAEDTTIPEHLILDIQDCGLSVPLGKTLTVEGKLIVDDFNIEQNPQLNQRGVLSIPEGGELHVKGWHDLSNNIWTNWRGTGETGRISFADDAGFILHRGDIGADGQGHSATDVFQFTLEDGNRILTEAPGHLKFDFGLRAGETVNMSGETLTIPAGFILTINGPLFTDGLLVNGSVTIGENAFVLVKEEFGVGQNVGEGMFTLNGTLSIKNTALSDPTQLEVVANNGMLDIYFEMFDADALLAELNAPTGNFGDHFRRSLWVLFPWELSDDLTLPGHVHLCVSAQGSDQGNLTIPEGVLLTIPETGQLFTGGDEGETVVQLNGGLVNNGELAIGDEMGYDPGEIAFGPKGFYAGFGTVTRLGRSDQILNDRTHADLLLPADLTKIESEALAGGVFDSVFIPDGTTSIADDAFGGREIVIFGELESFAETYARGKGYCFAPVA